MQKLLVYTENSKKKFGQQVRYSKCDQVFGAERVCGTLWKSMLYNGVYPTLQPEVKGNNIYINEAFQTGIRLQLVSLF